MEEVRDILLWGKGKSIILLEGSQALSARTYDKSSMKLKNLDWL
jgi:hypothetical protein